MSVEPVDELNLETAADPWVSTARWYAQAARELQEAGGWPDTAQRTVELAGKIAGADLAVLIGVPQVGAPPALLAATDYPVAEELVTLPRAAGAAPAWQAIIDRCTVQVDDLATDDRWPGYGAELVSALSFRTVLAFCLLIDDQPLACLTLYARQPAGFSAGQVELAAAFADHAAIAFHQTAQADKITNLKIALDHSRTISTALGIIMADRKITQDHAFDHLRRISQHHNRKLYELAHHIVQTGEIPD